MNPNPPKAPPAPIVPQPKGVEMELRDGRWIGVGNMTITTAKGIRRNNGSFEFKPSPLFKKPEVIRGKDIRTIRPLPPTPHDR